MEQHHYFVIARAIHVLGVVLWIGGVAFVTTILLPAIKQLTSPEKRLALFEQLESKFSFQAKFITLATGISGYVMLDIINGWDRYLYPQFWWMHLMTLVWGIFTLVLFVLEPLFLHQWFHKKAAQDSEKTFRIVHIMHIFLLSLSLIAVAGATVGSHGYTFIYG
ncbi:conserved membrane protein of unknown function [Shewanella benthica]|uniref:Copper resistance protein D domain-containing protein n=1 Tax=Shewanella benthica TaxID=43661 RepID=A0A330M227_9GAMM|nr:hypothetical protein [Shewanella benthica]SQH75514.1 conserved membrane protein of unknown function [Shewanella benthica]